MTENGSKFIIVDSNNTMTYLVQEAGGTWSYSINNDSYPKTIGYSNNAYASKYNAQNAVDASKPVATFTRLLKVSYNGNGATGSVDDQMSETATFATASNNFVMDGCTFTGWNTQPDGSGTSYSAGQSVTVNSSSYDITLYAQWMYNKLPFGGGDGSESNPYIISNSDEWEGLASYLNIGGASSGKYWKLTKSFSITTMVGDASHPFRGTFDGDGHTLTLALTSTSSADENLAPFRKVVDATIKNLTTAGIITTDASCATGLVGRSEGTVNITNCQSSVTINTSKSGDNTSGGLVASCSGTLTFTDCAFFGSITGAEATSCGGFVGWHSDGTLNIVRCLNAGALNIKATDQSATFARNGVSSITDSYYLNKVDRTDWNQGTQVFTTKQEGFLNKEITIFGTTYYLPALEGNGTADIPYLIKTIDTWNLFANNVDGGTDYSGQYVRLDADIEGVTTTAGTSGHPFRGTFDGNGRKMTLNITTPAKAENNDDAQKGWGPFRFTDGATIKNLWTAGTITCPNGESDLSIGGIIGRTIGSKVTTLSNCRSSVVIDMSAQTSDRDFTAGGLIGCTFQQGATIGNCLFDGEMKGEKAKCNGGFIGWATNDVIISNSVQAGTFSTNTSDCGTFARNSESKLTMVNCYYLNDYNDGTTTRSINYKSGSPTKLTADNMATEAAKLPKDHWTINGLSYPQLTLFVGLTLSETASNNLPDGVTYSVVYLNRTWAASGNWSTICLPFDVTKEELGEKAEIATFSGVETGTDYTTLMFTTIDDLPANTPALVKNATATQLFNKTTKAPTGLSTPQGSYTMTAVYAPMQLQAGDIVLSGNTFKVIDTTDPSVHDGQGDAGWVGAKPQHAPDATSGDDVIWGYDEGPTMKAFRAYFRSTSAPAKALLLSVDGTTTGIEAIQNSKFKIQNSNVYNLQGQRVGENYRGIVIVNGKKTIKK